MTRMEQIDLSDGLSNTRNLIERAIVLANTMIDDYFGMHNPDSEKGAFGIRYDFKRQSHFAYLLRDLLISIEAELPEATTVDGMRCEE